MAHKQDRHNCSVLINLKVFLSNPNQWRIHITGAHVPPESGLQWQPPQTQRIDEDLHDLIITCSSNFNTSQMTDILSKKHTIPDTTDTAPPTPSITKKRITGYVSGMKKRRNTRDHNVKPQYCRRTKTASDGDNTSAEYSQIQVGEQPQGVDSSTEGGESTVVHCIVPGDFRDIQVDQQIVINSDQIPISSVENLTLYHMLENGQVKEIVEQAEGGINMRDQQQMDCVQGEQQIGQVASVDGIGDNSAVTDFDALLMVASQQQNQ